MRTWRCLAEGLATDLDLEAIDLAEDVLMHRNGGVFAASGRFREMAKRQMRMVHPLRRCAVCELQFMGRLEKPLRQSQHIDEICVQLYMDQLGHGINGRHRR